MTWRAVVAALDDGEAFRSSVSMYQHPLAGRPVLWHLVSALLGVDHPPAEVRVLHRADASLALPDLPDTVRYVPVARGENTGRTLPHANVVHSLSRLGAWTGDAIALPLPTGASGLSTAVLVQMPDGGPILAAATN